MTTRKSTITTLRVTLEAASKHHDEAAKNNSLYATAGTQVELDWASKRLHAAANQLEAEVQRIAAITSPIATSRGAIEWIASQILDRDIPGLDMGVDVDFEQWTSAGELGHFRAVWKGIGGDPDRVDAAIVITPEHHSEGRATLRVLVTLTGGPWIPEHALELAKLNLAVAELAKEVSDPWVDKALALNPVVVS